MKKSVSRVLAIMLAVLLVSTLFAGCEKKEGDSQAVTTQNSGSSNETTQSAPKEKIKLSFTGWTPVAFPQENSWAEKVIEETFPDVDWTFILFERETWEDQLNTRVASGEVPDIIYRDDRPHVQDYVAQDILAEVPYSMIKENAPETFAAYAKYDREDAWLVTLFNNKNYGLPLLVALDSLGGVMGYRKDWMDKVGVTKVPETIDELTDLMTKFAQDDPDGNGADDTFGTTTIGMNYNDMVSYIDNMWNSYSVAPNMWNTAPDGSLQYGMVTDKSKEVLTLLNKWYKSGALDPEFVTTDGGMFKQKWANSKFGCMKTGYAKLLAGKTEGDKGGKYYSMVHEVNPKAEIQMGPLVTGPDGKLGIYGYGALTSAVCFRKGLEEEKMAKALQIMDKCIYDKDFNIKLRYGQEGLHWNLDKNTNMPAYVKPYDTDDGRNQLGLNGLWGIAMLPMSDEVAPDELTNLGFGIKPKAGEEDWKYALVTAKLNSARDGVDYIPWAGYFYPDEVAQKSANTEQVEAKWVVNFITGKKSLDEFDSFRKEWNNAGGAEMTKAANDALKEIESLRNVYRAGIK